MLGDAHWTVQRWSVKQIRRPRLRAATVAPLSGRPPFSDNDVGNNDVDLVNVSAWKAARSGRWLAGCGPARCWTKLAVSGWQACRGTKRHLSERVGVTPHAFCRPARRS